MVMSKPKTKLTSIKLLESLYDRFKIATVTTKMTLQKLTNRTINLYLTDDDFRDTIDTADELMNSGSVNF